MPRQKRAENELGAVAFRRGTLWSSQVGAHAGERVRVAGWLHNQRRLSGRTFLVLRDGQGTLQVVIEEQALIDEIGALLPETVIEAEGLVVAMPRAPGGVELHEPRIEVISRPAEAPPIELKRKVLKEQLPTILDHAPIAHRHPRRQAIFRFRRLHGISPNTSHSTPRSGSSPRTVT